MRDYIKRGDSIKILFVGNSITRHAPTPKIGWYNDWGMAASKKDKDYVHLIMQHIRAYEPNAKHCIAQVANWEREYWKMDLFGLYEEAKLFKPDIIISKVGENVPRNIHNKLPYKKCFEGLIDYLNSDNSAKVIIATSFWARGEIDEAMRLVSYERGYPVIELGDLGKWDEMKAVSLFKNRGVGDHPGDRGMKEIADRIIKVILEIAADIV